MIDQWSLTSSPTGNQNPLSGWSRMISLFLLKVMTESSGTWSFPEIGYYMVFLDWVGSVMQVKIIDGQTLILC